MTARVPAAGAIATLAAAIALAGCGWGGDDAEQAELPPEQPTTTAPPATAPAAPPESGPKPEIGDGRGGVRLEEVGDFSSPVYVTQPRGERDHLYVVEQGGAIRTVRNGDVLSKPFLDLSGSVQAGGERGLLSMAFAPDYADSDKFYVNFTDGNGTTRIQEYTASSPTSADPGSRRELLSIQQPFANHNGGLVIFGPDEMLYIGTGDGGSAGDPQRNGQKLSTLLGKILRIDPEPRGGRPYTVPRDNPFVGRRGARNEIYSFGLRNPWRFSFDRDSGDLSIGDVGQNSLEEIDYVREGEGNGANFGWSALEGSSRFNDDQDPAGHIPPVLEYGRGGGCSVTGGYVVRDPELRSLFGRYLYADFCKGELRSFVPDVSGAEGDRALGPNVTSPSSFGEDSAGRVYVVSLNGPVFRLAPG